MKERKLRVLVLVHKSLIPPDDITTFDLDKVPWRTEHYVISNLKKSGHFIRIVGLDNDLKVIRDAKAEFKPHIAFNLMEEFDGEALFDHNVVSYLELLKIPYTGCNPKGLILSRDKSLSKKILYYHRIKTPQFIVVRRGKKLKLKSSIKFPLIVKSLTDEGSAGISQSSVVNDAKKLNERISFVHDSLLADAIVESFIEGNDLYISILGNKQITVFPPLELQYKNAPDHWHNIATSKFKWNPEFRKKYQIDVNFPQNLTNELIKKIEQTGRKIYKRLELSGYARIDLRLTPQGELYFIEANPNPDIAEPDEFALSALKHNISYKKLLDKILKLGFSWEKSRNY